MALKCMRVACKRPINASAAFVCGHNFPHVAVAATMTRACATSRETVRIPSLELARALPVHMHELPNETLYVLAEQGSHEACTERLVRNVMAVDGLEWIAAKSRVNEIANENNKIKWLATFPYKMGLTVAAVAGIGSVPMVFHRGTAQWFNEYYVTTDVPEPKDLETIWEVGSWTWNWMEP